MNEMIPENVIEALAEARAIGTYNMFDRKGVISLIENFDEDAAEWLNVNKDRYMDALNEMGASLNRN